MSAAQSGTVVQAGDSPDDQLLDRLRDAWLRADPVPATLAERALFAVRLEGLDAELAALVDSLALVGARSATRPDETPQLVRTVTFSSDSLTATVTLSDAAAGTTRLDGWLAPAEALRVEVRRQDRAGTEVFADADGRFVVDGLVRGLVQLVFHPVTGTDGALRTPVATPPVRL